MAITKLRNYFLSDAAPGKLFRSEDEATAAEAANAARMSTIDELTNQILGQNMTQYWSGEGYGGASQNARALATWLNNAGITKLSDLGVRAYETFDPVEELYRTLDNQFVNSRVDESGNTIYYTYDPGWDLGGEQRITAEEYAKAKPVYGRVNFAGFDDFFSPGLSADEQSRIVERDGKAMLRNALPEFYSKSTGKTLSDIPYGGRDIHYVADEATPYGFTEVKPGEFYNIGRTFAGDGSTNYNVAFDAQGNPYFTTSYGGSTSDWGSAAPFLGIAALAFGVPYLTEALGAAGAGAGAAGAGAAGAGAATAAELGASFAADMAAAGIGSTAAGAGAAGAGALGAGAAAGAGATAGGSLAANLGLALGVPSQYASVVGNALIRGTLSELTGGDFIKGAALGAAMSPTVLGEIGGKAAEALGVSDASNAAKQAIGSAVVNFGASGGDIEKTLKGAGLTYAANAMTPVWKSGPTAKDMEAGSFGGVDGSFDPKTAGGIDTAGMFPAGAQTAQEAKSAMSDIASTAAPLLKTAKEAKPIVDAAMATNKLANAVSAAKSAKEGSDNTAAILSAIGAVAAAPTEFAYSPQQAGQTGDDGVKSFEELGYGDLFGGELQFGQTQDDLLKLLRG